MSITIGKQYEEKTCAVCKNKFMPDDQTEIPISNTEDALAFGVKTGEHVCLRCILAWCDKELEKEEQSPERIRERQQSQLYLAEAQVNLRAANRILSRSRNRVSRTEPLGRFR